MVTAVSSWLAALTVWPAPAAPTWTIVEPIASRTGRAAATSLRVATDHDRQRAVDRAPLTAADRGVEHPDAPGPAGRGERDGGGRTDGAHVDVERPRPGERERAGVPEGESLDVRRVGQHGDHHVTVPRGLRRARRAAATGLDQPVDLAARPVVAHHVEPGLDQVRGHRAAHDAQADEADRAHRHPRSPLCGRSRRRRDRPRLPTPRRAGPAARTPRACAGPR